MDEFRSGSDEYREAVDYGDKEQRRQFLSPSERINLSTPETSLDRHQIWVFVIVAREDQFPGMSCRY